MKRIPLRKRPRNDSVLQTRPQLLTPADLVRVANDGVQPIAAWLEHVAETGQLSGKAKVRITTIVRELGIRTYPLFQTDGASIMWAREYPGDSMSAEIEWAVAITAVAEQGNLPRFRRCVLPDCRSYFVGDPRSRWCSNACGSKARVTAKRNEMSTDAWLRAQVRQKGER